MKMCQDHWDRLRSAIAERGLATLVAESGEEVATKARREAEEGVTIDTFDPLMGAHNAILENAIGLLGVGAIAMPGCCLCYLNDQSKTHLPTCSDPDCAQADGSAFEKWIDFAADEMLTIWKGLRP